MATNMETPDKTASLRGTAAAGVQVLARLRAHPLRTALQCGAEARTVEDITKSIRFRLFDELLLRSSV